MSFAVDGRGRMHVLDQVNGRVVRHAADGTAEAAIKLDLKTPQDIVATPDGSTVVLDRHAGKAVAIYDPSGKFRGEIPLDLTTVGDPGLVTGVFVDGNDVYVEKEHGTLVKVGGLDGSKAASLTEIPGRPTRDGKSFIKAGITDPATGRIFVAAMSRPGGEHRFTREIRLGAGVQALVLLDSDAKGTIYLAAEVDRDGALSVHLACLDPLTGKPTGTAELPVNTLPEETFRDLSVEDGGGVVYALRSESGVAYQRFNCH